jgi:multiple sugar transport system permease protein
MTVSAPANHKNLSLPPFSKGRRGGFGSILTDIQMFLSKEHVVGYLFIIPIVVVILGLIAYPFFDAIWLSLCEKYIGKPARFIGLGNFITLLGDATFLRTVRNSFVFTFISLVAKVTLGLLLALLLNQKFRFRNIFRGLLFLPWIMPIAIGALVWRWMFNDMYGSINYILLKTGLADKPLPWLGSAGLAMFSVITVNVWRSLPFYGLTMLAGMQTIPKHLYEAADIDGASRFQKFLFITLPGIKHVLIIVTMLGTIWTFANFEIVFLMTKGGPSVSTHLFATLTYEVGIFGYSLGKGVAVSLYMFPMLAAMIIILARHLYKAEE